MVIIAKYILRCYVSITAKAKDNTERMIYMKLYQVGYYAFNDSFSDMKFYHMLAVGTSSEDAIERAKKVAPKEARDFRAYPVYDVMGYRIRVGD